MSDIQEKITTTLSPELSGAIRVLATKMNKTLEETLTQVLQRGVYDVNYRHDRMRMQLQEMREFRTWRKANQEVK